MASEDMSAAPDPSQRYWAFVSYSQRDAAWAQRLHAKLESYRVPWSVVGRRTGDRVVPRRLVPVFRDRSELASTADLSGEIRAALQCSGALIVICSPHAAASRWVEEEIRTFKALGRGERIFPLIIDGEPNAPEQDTSRVECFAPSLRFDFRPDGARTKPLIEPLAADVRAGKDGWKDACLRLIAGILNVRFDELRRRELRRQRRNRLGFAMAAFVAVVVTGLGYAGLADAGVAVWGGAPLQRHIDRYGCSVFRRIPGAEEIFQASCGSFGRTHPT
jgi:eukaryotic-like serine/threonine-protein kinase